jgi:hypothetical protein
VSPPARIRCAHSLSKTLDGISYDRRSLRTSDDLRCENPKVTFAFEPRAKFRVLALSSCMRSSKSLAA